MWLTRPIGQRVARDEVVHAFINYRRGEQSMTATNSSSAASKSGSSWPRTSLPKAKSQKPESPVDPHDAR
ncbi:MAG: hypothetical protein M3Q50_10150, partial [Chloroflexota bacterium]|nr:hypothetical protein [Chloroflexota bacterium]